MSFLFGGGSEFHKLERRETGTDWVEADTGAIDPAKIEMATAELDMITDVL